MVAIFDRIHLHGQTEIADYGRLFFSWLFFVAVSINGIGFSHFIPLFPAQTKTEQTQGSGRTAL